MIPFNNFNLLSSVKGESPFPFYKWLSTSLYNKVCDQASTVFVFSNWLTLLIFNLNFMYSNWCIKILFVNDPKDNKWYETCLAFSTFPLSVLIYTIGLLITGTFTFSATIILFPVVFAIHCLSKVIQQIKFHKKTIQDMDALLMDKDNEISSIKIRQFLKKHSFDYFDKSVEVTAWQYASELQIISDKNDYSLTIELKDKNKKGIDELAQTDSRFLKALNEVNYYDRQIRAPK